MFEFILYSVDIVYIKQIVTFYPGYAHYLPRSQRTNEQLSSLLTLILNPRNPCHP